MNSTILPLTLNHTQSCYQKRDTHSDQVTTWFQQGPTHTFPFSSKGHRQWSSGSWQTAVYRPASWARVHILFHRPPPESAEPLAISTYIFYCHSTAFGSKGSVAITLLCALRIKYFLLLAVNLLFQHCTGHPLVLQGGNFWGAISTALTAIQKSDPSISLLPSLRTQAHLPPNSIFYFGAFCFSSSTVQSLRQTDCSHYARQTRTVGFYRDVILGFALSLTLTLFHGSLLWALEFKPSQKQQAIVKVS